MMTSFVYVHMDETVLKSLFQYNVCSSRSFWIHKYFSSISNRTGCKTKAKAATKWHSVLGRVNLLWPIDAIWRHRSGSALARVMTCCLATRKPLPEPMLTCHQWGPVAVTWGQFYKGCPNHQLLNQLKMYLLLCLNLPEANGLTLLVQMPEYSGNDRFMLYLVMPWRLAYTGQQPVWYRPCTINGHCLQLWRIATTCAILTLLHH